VAESTGKHGKGIVPVVAEPTLDPDGYSDDRVFVIVTTDAADDLTALDLAARLSRAGHPVVETHLRDLFDIGAEMFRWEMATAVIGSVLRINPFDQPDVQLAKDLAKRAMAGDEDTSKEIAEEEMIRAQDTRSLKRATDRWAAQVNQGDYVTLQAYLPPDTRTTEILQQIRTRLGTRLGVATTRGYGPRFLHSTGQLHKGGPDTGVFLQLVDSPGVEVPVPETDFGFGALIDAQARGDYRALVQRGRRVMRVDLGRDVDGGLAALLNAVT
jgi:transaldolase/glucose-6-phosphate isomerase